MTYGDLAIRKLLIPCSANSIPDRLLGQEDVPVGGLRDGHRRHPTAQAESAEDGQDLPMALRSGFGTRCPPLARA